MQYIGQEQAIKADGKTFRLSRFTVKLLRTWFQWADSFLESPLAIAEKHLATFPEPDVLIAVAQDYAGDRFSFSDDAVWVLWTSPVGIGHAFGLLLDKYHSGESADPIIEALGMVQVERLLAKANGFPPVDTNEIKRNYFVSIGLMEPEEEGKKRKMEWEELHRSIFQNLHLTPQQIDDLTPTEICVLCKEDDKKEINSLALAGGNIFELAKLQAQLTPSQQLELAKLLYRS